MPRKNVRNTTSPRPKRNEHGLLPLQEAFCHAYIANKFISYRAYMDAYKVTNEEIAMAASTDVMKNPAVKKRIDDLFAEYLANTKARAQEIMHEQYLIATADMKNMFDSNGQLKDIHKMGECSKIVQSIEMSTLADGTILNRKAKYYDKQKALDFLGKVTGLVSDSPAINNNVNINGQPDFSRLTDDELRTLSVLSKKLHDEC